jgi:hypothetical protein
LNFVENVFRHRSCQAAQHWARECADDRRDRAGHKSHQTFHQLGDRRIVGMLSFGDFVLQNTKLLLSRGLFLRPGGFDDLPNGTEHVVALSRWQVLNLVPSDDVAAACADVTARDRDTAARRIFRHVTSSPSAKHKYFKSQSARPRRG